MVVKALHITCSWVSNAIDDIDYIVPKLMVYTCSGGNVGSTNQLVDR